jgi:ferric-dicitrate binding protein FerR (iron transport regulator)
MIEKNKYIVLFEKYLRNEISEQEREILLLLLRNDKRIDDFFQSELENADSELDEETANRIFTYICSKTSPEKKTISFASFWKKTARWAAIFILPILSLFGVYYLLNNSDIEDCLPVIIVTAYGERAEVTLADGSRVWINSGSSLAYDSRCFNRKERRVWLTGEAYFEVAGNKKRPFVVVTPEMEIEAKGTNFNVRAYTGDEQASIVLLEGKVLVSTSTQETLLTENQRATLCKSTYLLTTDYVYVAHFIEWKRGRLFFDNESFEEITRTLSRAFGFEIHFASKELKPIRFSGTLPSNSIHNTLGLLSLTSPMRYEIEGGMIRLHYDR